MIVIATNNGHRFLPELIPALERLGTGGYEVLLVDTGSTDPRTLELLEELKSYEGPLRLRVTCTPYRGYDTGAYIHAYREFPADRYIFLQDSLMPKHGGWVEEFGSRFSFGVGVVPWLVFPLTWDSEEQRQFVSSRYACRQAPPYGIFGPIFAAERTALERLDRKSLLNVIPTSKAEQQGMERGWSLAFFLAEIAVRPIENTFNHTRLLEHGYATFEKRLPRRR